MSERGVSRRTFILGLACAILISILGTFTVLQVTDFVAPRAAPEAPMLAFAHWDVSWRIASYVSGIGMYRLFVEVGTAEFPTTFDYDWGYSMPFENHYDRIGFEATMRVKVQRDAPITFTVGGDDGYQLLIDGEEYISRWYTHGYSTSSTTVSLEKGFHTLTMRWFEWYGYARASFSCSASDIFIYYP
jgi:hypothetical protein